MSLKMLSLSNTFNVIHKIDCEVHHCHCKTFYIDKARKLNFSIIIKTSYVELKTKINST